MRFPFIKRKKTRRKKKCSFMNIAVAFVLMTVFAFTIVWTIGFFHIGSEPATLITCFFAFMGVEGGCMAWIKNVKTKESTKTGRTEEKIQEQQDGGQMTEDFTEEPEE